MAKRTTIMGLPIGKKKKRRHLLTPRHVATGAAVAAVPVAGVIRKMGGSISAGREKLEAGREKVEAGREKVETVSDLADKAGKVTEAMGGHSSTIGKVVAAGREIRRLSGSKGGDSAPKLSHLIEQHIDVAVPRSVAYDQWTQFEVFPAITKGVESVEQRERDKLQWTSKIGPSRRSWQGEITQQVPDERIAWKSTGGAQLKGAVTFHSLDDELTKVLVEIEYDPRGAVEHVGNLLRIQRRRVRRDLRLFKHFVELRGEATGSWRGRIAKKEDGEQGDDSGADRSQGREGSRHRRAVASDERGVSARTRNGSSAAKNGTRRPKSASKGSTSSSVKAGRKSGGAGAKPNRAKRAGSERRAS